MHRPRSDHDGATPHAAGLATLGLLRAAALSGRDDLRKVAESVIRMHAYALERTPQAYPTLLRAVAFAARGANVAVIVGHPVTPATRALAQRARRRLLPEDGVVVWSPESSVPEGLDPSWVAGRRLHEGRPSAYVCHGTSCSLPVTDPEKLDDLETLMREAIETSPA